MNDDLILRAARLAAVAHNGQMRKWVHLNADPYISHPMRVAGLVALSLQSTPAMVAAAWLDTTTLTLIIETPQRLKIGIVKAFSLLCRVFQVERRTWDDMVYMPALVSVVIPSHTCLEKGFKVTFEFFKGATEEFQGSLGFINSYQRFAYACSQIYRQAKTHITMEKFIPCKVSFLAGIGCLSQDSISFQDFSLVGFISSLSGRFRLFGMRILTSLLKFTFSIFQIPSPPDFFTARAAMTVNAKSAVFAFVEFGQRLVQFTSSTFLFHKTIIPNAMIY